MKNFTVIIALMLLAAGASAQNKVREMANETYVNRAKTTGVKKEGDMPTGTKKDGVLVGDKRPGKKQEASKDGVLVGDRSGDIQGSNKDGVWVGDRSEEGGDMDNGGKEDGDTHGTGGETGTNNKDGVLVGDKIAPVKPGIYPNPTTGQATIRAPHGATISYVQVFNTQGRQQMTVNGNKNQNLSINLGGLNPGIYIFRIILSNGASQSVSIIRK